MEIEMKTAPKLENGEYKGVITDVQYDTDPYDYTRILVKVEGTETILTYSCPTNLSDGSKLMRVLQAFGVAFQEGQKIDPSQVLINKNVKFYIANKPSKKDATKMFANISEDTLSPL